MSWSAPQRRLLEALGYELLVPGRVGSPVATTVAGAPVAAAPIAGAASSTARLFEALRRAASGADPSSLVGDLELLRRDPVRKRALWPALRALRRTPR